MKKIYFIISIALLGIILFSYSGWTKTPGSAKLVFWWQKPFADSCVANGVTKADLYVGGLFQGELLVGTQYYSYLPDCGDHGTVTYSEKTDKGHVIDVSTTVGIATVVKHIDTIVGVEPNECRNFRLRW